MTRRSGDSSNGTHSAYLHQKKERERERDEGHCPPLRKMMFPDELLKLVLKKTSSEDHMRQCEKYPSISGIFHSVLFYISFTCRRPIITKDTAPVLYSSASGNVFASLF